MTGAAASPALPAPFRADRAERLALPVSYVLAYLYVDLFWFTPSAPLQRLLLTAFTVLFCAGTELLFRRENRLYQQTESTDANLCSFCVWDMPAPCLAVAATGKTLCTEWPRTVMRGG